MPRPSLYGTLPEQLDDPDSFARRLRGSCVREQSGIATSTLLDVPDVSQRGMLGDGPPAGGRGPQVTVLNFSGQDIAGGSAPRTSLPGTASTTFQRRGRR